MLDESTNKCTMKHIELSGTYQKGLGLYVYLVLGIRTIWYYRLSTYFHSIVVSNKCTWRFSASIQLKEILFHFGKAIEGLCKSRYMPLLERQIMKQVIIGMYFDS